MISLGSVSALGLALSARDSRVFSCRAVYARTSDSISYCNQLLMPNFNNHINFSAGVSVTTCLYIPDSAH